VIRVRVGRGMLPWKWPNTRKQADITGESGRRQLKGAIYKWSWRQGPLGTTESAGEYIGTISPFVH
jgi:hypothetical protein